ncbi:MAG: hypothetical protein AAGJ08_07270 [Cyanobacteria bacterium P01_H01_bin.35]
MTRHYDFFRLMDLVAIAWAISDYYIHLSYRIRIIAIAQSLRLERSGRFPEHSGTDSNLRGVRRLPRIVTKDFNPWLIA